MKLTFFLSGLGYSWVENGKLVSKDHLKQALGMTAELLKEHATAPGFSEDQERQQFWQGRAAMYIDGSWAVGYKDHAADSVKKAYRVAPLPFPDAAGGPSNVLAIPAALPKERKDLAFKFIELIQRPEWQRKYAEMTGNPPARIMPLSKEALAKWPEIGVFVDSTKNAKLSYLPVGKETEFAKWSNIVSEGVSGLAGGALTLDQAVDQIHDELQSAFF
jgi:ABC-type glycerol-3-phosphate transport system substrate-binding protein